MATSLSKDLRPASFRGVPFQVDASELEVGRRVEVHEYPQRDKPHAEDLGRLARGINVDGFVVGADYLAQAKRLSDALEEAGPGALVHPWLGDMMVSLRGDPVRVMFNTQLGYARISMSFVEAGELVFPVAGSSTPSVTRLAASELEAAAVTDFANSFTVDGYQDFVATNAAAGLTGAVDVVSGSKVPGMDAFGYATQGAAMLSDVLSMVSNPLLLANTVVSYLGVASYVGNLDPYVSAGKGWVSLAQSLVRMAQLAGFLPPAAPTVYTPSRQQAYVNSRAINALFRQVLLAQAVGASSVASASVYDDSKLLRDRLTAAMDAESLTASDGAYTALQAARSAVWQDLTDRSRDGARLTSRTPSETVPALVLAYDLYEDASRDAEICTRNAAVRHPGFVPPVPLKVLTR
jgi:prophage DNA circulation protein